MLLEKIYRRLLREAEELSGEEFSAKILSRVEKASKQKLALFEFTKDNKQNFFLYRPDKLIKELSDYVLSNQYETIETRALRLKIAGILLGEALLGTIKISKKSGMCHDASVVNISAVDEGYGPMLYDIAMTMSPSGKIMSDRLSISNLASNYYKQLHKRSDIKAEPFEDPLTSSGEGACARWSDEYPDMEHLDYAFSRTSDFDATQLLDAHENTLSEISEILLQFGFDQMSTEQILKIAFDEVQPDFFSKRYAKVPDSQIRVRS